MDDLYGELGVDRDASPDEIRAAYRRAAKGAHPDAPGGSEEAFGRVSKALAVLSDPKRRADYDRTGQAEDVRADDSRQRAMQLAFSTVCMVLGEIEKRGGKVGHYDVVKMAATHLQDNIREINGKIAVAKKDEAKAMKIAKRFTAKNGAPNHLRLMMEARGKDMAAAAHGFVKERELCLAAIAVLRDHGYDKEAPPPPAPNYAAALGIHF
jgi:DnaJ-class molecular chaperone